MKNVNNNQSAPKGDSSIFLHNVKEHATLSAGASVDHGSEVEATEDHVNRTADRGCCVSTCSVSSSFGGVGEIREVPIDSARCVDEGHIDSLLDGLPMSVAATTGIRKGWT